MAIVARSQKEYRDWKQAESIVFKIRSGKTIRYDPSSSVGRKINYLLDKGLYANVAITRRNIEIQKHNIEVEKKAIDLAKQGYLVTSTKEGYEIEKPQLARIKDPSKKPSGYITKTPGLKQQYKEIVAREGYIKGTLGFIGMKARGVVEKQEVRAMQGKPSVFMPGISGGRSYGSAELGPTVEGSIRYSPYFTPVGSTLLMAGGTEELITPSGRKRIKAQQTYYQKQKGYSPTKAKIASYSLPAIEVGFGALGVTSQVKGLGAVYKTRKPKTTFIAEQTPVKTPGGVYTRARVISKTRIGKKDFLGITEQRIYQPKGQEIYISGGKGYLIESGGKYLKPSIKGLQVTENIYSTPIKTFGVSKPLGKGARVKETLIPVKRGALDYPIIKIPSKPLSGIYSKTGIKIKGEIIKQDLVGGYRSIGDTGVYGYVGGKPTKIRFYENVIPSLRRRTYIAPKEITGFVYTPKTLDKIGITIKGQRPVISKTIQKSIQEQVGAQRAGAITAYKSGVQKIRGIPATRPTIRRETITARPETRLMQRTKLITPQKIEVKPKITQTYYYAPKISQRPRTRLKTITGLTQTSAVAVAEKERLKFTPAQAQMLKTAQKQKQIVKIKTISPKIITPTTPPYIPPTGGVPLFPITLPGLGMAGGLGKRRIPVIKIVRYTPSFGAVFFNIRGSRPKGIETGLRLRPITPGFKWIKMRKL